MQGMSPADAVQMVESEDYSAMGGDDEGDGGDGEVQGADQKEGTYGPFNLPLTPESQWLQQDPSLDTSQQRAIRRGITRGFSYDDAVKLARNLAKAAPKDKEAKGPDGEIRQSELGTGGVGKKTTGVTKRKFKANIQRVRALVDGKVVRIKVSAKAIKMGLVVKPPKRNYKPAEQAAD